MLKTLKETALDFCTIGVIMSFIVAFIRPYVSIKQKIRDILLTFTFSMLAGLLLEYWAIPFGVKAGISGVCGLFGIWLYELVVAILQYARRHPEEVLKKLDK